MPNTQANSQPNFQGFSDPNFTPVPDELFDELLASLGGAELKVLLYIVRRTYGFKKRSDRVSKSQLENGIQRLDGTTLDAGTGLSRRAIRLAVDSLVARGILIKHAHQSAEKGFEATEYSLHRRSEKASEADSAQHSPPGVLSTQALGPEVPKPLGRGVPIQETGLQETVGQHTEAYEHSHLSLEPDGNISKFRKGTPKNFDSGNTGESNALSAQRTPTGFASVGSVLAEAMHPTGRPDAATPEPASSRTQEPVRVPATEQADSQTTRDKSEALAAISEPEKTRRSKHSAPASEPVYSEDRQLVAAYIRDFAMEFHDQASLTASVTRAARLLAKSEYPQERWSEKLYEARSMTRERSAAIGWQGDGEPRAGQTTFGLNKMPYFFGVLECVLGLHDHPAGQHPMPLSEQEFKQQSSRRGRPAKVRANPQDTLAEQNGEPERKSLAGKYAHLVQR